MAEQVLQGGKQPVRHPRPSLPHPLDQRLQFMYAYVGNLILSQYWVMCLYLEYSMWYRGCTAGLDQRLQFMYAYEGKRILWENWGV